MNKIQTVRDARLAKQLQDDYAAARDARRRAKAGPTLAEVCARAAAMGPEYGVMTRRGKPAIYTTTPSGDVTFV
jgi:hypothetical protein